MSENPTPTEAARDTADVVCDIPAVFMLDMGTYAAAGEVGYEGIGYYFAGRGGVLGDVDADVVAAAFVFFPPGPVRVGWESAAAVESRPESAARWAADAAAWGCEHLPEDGPDYERFAELLKLVIDAADPAGAPVFAGWRGLPEPTDPRALVLHRLNALRELRAARHGVAVLAAGIKPVEALMVNSPYMADIFGWPEPRPEPDDDLRARWQAAEDRTNELFGRDLAVLDGDQLTELVELGAAIHAAVT